MLRGLLSDSRIALERALAAGDARPRVRETGVVRQVGSGIARVAGLPGLGAEELVELPGGLFGLAVDLEPEDAGVVLLGPSAHLAAGDEARATGRLVDAPVGAALLGRVLDATGRTLDGKGALAATARRPVETAAPAILDRAPITVPLQTGLKVVDALVPIGRGQRELIVGDRQTGKTTIAVDTILNQRGRDVVCVYCAIGQRGTAVARVVDTLRRHGALAYSIVVVASGEDPPGLQFVTPYAATAMAEHFMEQGRDVLIVYDDLTRHARAYRELSLLLRRPPGREAFPGDIFYIHSRLLERATRLCAERGGGSLTALPIVETQAQDISAYIPTNLISITDGQIYVSPEHFRKGLLPAVDVGRSVSRVGGKAQLRAYRAVAGELRLAYAQFEELETFSRFATRLDEDTRATIERGRRVREVLKQDESAPLSVGMQLVALRAVVDGLLDRVPLDAVVGTEQAIRGAAANAHPELLARIDSGAALSDEEWHALAQTIRHALAAD
ncbi:MAG TPA: alternate F1F0 ATPase, F1 subunit alpha [Burkholderiaceae bacterium]|jgi:F-type H+-transporting ATPase subunit alpha|nr:alternate F1F0 ATPase, F1 subunit alpha [Burkholderiaceae bacterium]HMM52660.1 alternate F1F0 ATPase, F1 subunit alpha [Burkholderiaceae bacterium]